jgi:hypothetical protein
VERQARWFGMAMFNRMAWSEKTHITDLADAAGQRDLFDPPARAPS